MLTVAAGPPLHTGASFDVIVVGAGAAGAATALLLARRGVRTLLLEQDGLGTGDASTHLLTRAGVLLLARWGVLDSVIGAGTPPIRRTTYRYDGEHVVMSVLPSHGVDALYAPRRSVLDRLLVRAAAEAGALVHHRTRVDGVLHRGDRVVGVNATTPDGRLVEVRATLVVGADGRNSTVARCSRAARWRLATHASATTYGYWSDLAVDGAEWNFGAGACSGAVPTSDGQVCVFARASPERIGAGGADCIRAIVGDGAPELGTHLERAAPPRRTGSWSGRGAIRDPFGRGWALVGDAGWSSEPFGGHGTTASLRDAELLARAVSAGLGDDRTLCEDLAHYGATRDRLGLPLFDVADRIAGPEWDGAEIADQLRRLNSAMAAEVDTLTALEPWRTT
jgi:2-polyprenyl-6-methoxyphenol hydroxylase-like FAD-dependent oxidoreductase